MNPDADFVLHGRLTPIAEKKGGSSYLTNSQKTSTTRRLSQHEKPLDAADSGHGHTLSSGAYPGAYRPRRRSSSPLKDSSNDLLTLDLASLNSSLNKSLNSSLNKSLNSSLNKSLNKSVTFHDKVKAKRGGDHDESDDNDSVSAELQRLIDREDEENARGGGYAFDSGLIGRPRSADQAQWFTEPVHLVNSTEFPALQSLGIDTREVSPVHRRVGDIGTDLASRKLISENFVDGEALREFPVSLGVLGRGKSMLRTFSPSPPLRTADPPHHWSGGPASRVRPSTAPPSQPPSQGTADLHPKTQALNDYHFLQAAEPYLARCPVVPSLYQHQLARLRIERLRLEEARLLEKKRQAELERIRGPAPKWYEMKGRQFCYEAKKNNDMLCKRKHWQSLYDYRQSLLSASQVFNNTL